MNWETPIHFVRPVRLWSPDPIHSRRVSWLELFFDLIFVAAVAQVGVPLGEDYTVHGLVRYALMFLLIWWAWLGHTMYSPVLTPMMSCSGCSLCCRSLPRLRWPRMQRLLSTAEIPLALAQHTQSYVLFKSSNISGPAV